MASILRISAARVLRAPAWDALFVALSGAHGAVLALAPAAPVVAVLLWWNANTISHNFIHRPFFRHRAANRLYSAYLTLVLGFPQTLWRERHLRHHGELAGGPKPGPPNEAHVGRSGLWSAMRGFVGRSGLIVGRSGFWTGTSFELALLAAFWTLLATQATSWLLTAYLPGWAIGLGLCQLQGHYEHARGTTSHYGRVYNFLFFNDGLHIEHHRRPGAHWTELRHDVRRDAPHSRWPPVLRWLDALSHEGLERLVLRSPRLQRFVIASHEQAFRRLLPLVGDVRRVTIVGGGLFPRTAIVLRRLLPDADLTIVDASAAHLALARPMVGDDIRLVHRRFDPDDDSDADLIVVPLSCSRERRRVYERPPARAVLVHDWIFAARRPSAVVSWLLLKRLNLILTNGACLRRP